MQQLLGDKVVDGSFLRELFLQRLPTNVRMVLASAHDDSTSIEKLAQLVDKAVKVVAPTSVSSVSASQVTEELERLHVEVSDLKILVKSIPPTASGRRGHHRSHSRGHSPSPHPIQNQNTNITYLYAGTTATMGKMQGNANPVLRETSRPAVNGD